MTSVNIGHVAGVRSLLKYRAGLETQNSNGQNVAHLIVQNAQHNSEKMVEIWNVVCDSVYDEACKEVWGYNVERRRNFFQEARGNLYLVTRTRTRKRTSESVGDRTMLNNFNETAVEMASRLGYTDILKAMIECCSIFCHDKTGLTATYYDVRGLIPLPFQQPRREHASQTPCSSPSVNHQSGEGIEMEKLQKSGPFSSVRTTHRLKRNPSSTAHSDVSPISCLQLIAECCATDVAVRALAMV
jgi:hypothetical protein